MCLSAHNTSCPALLTRRSPHRGQSDDEAKDGPLTKLHTVKQQLVFLRRKEQTHTLCSTHTPEPFTLRLDAQQRARLQQQLQQVQSAAYLHQVASAAWTRFTS